MDVVHTKKEIMSHGPNIVLGKIGVNRCQETSCTATRSRERKRKPTWLPQKESGMEQFVFDIGSIVRDDTTKHCYGMNVVLS